MLRIAYDGTNYVGWQLQPNGPSIEAEINKALSAATGENIEVIGASRTDSGVHAEDNVAVFDTESRIPADKFCFALNRRLPEDITVTESCEVAPDFHPRYAECVKTYEYKIYNALHPDPMSRRYTYFYHGSLDVDRMDEAAHFLIGEHDFASFCAAGAQVKTTVRTIYDAEVEQTGKVITIRLRGNGFLYNMVRIIAGTLIQFGMDMYRPEYMRDIIGACDRTAAGPTAPPQGLTLMKIDYSGADAPGRESEDAYEV